MSSTLRHLVLGLHVICVAALLKKKKKAKLSHPTATATEKEVVEKDAEKEKEKAPITGPAAAATPIAASVGA